MTSRRSRLAGVGLPHGPLSRAAPLCLALPSPPSTTETFIQSYLARLPFAIEVVQGHGPFWDQQGRRVFGRGWPSHQINRVLRRLSPGAWRRQRDAALARQLLRTGTACVLAEYGPTAVEVLPACSSARTPLVARFHGYDAYRHAELERFEALYSRLFREAAAIVAVSRHMKDQLLRIGAPEARVHCIPSGTDMDLFVASDPGSRPPRFLAVGRFVAKKGPLATVSAFARVSRECPEATLTMIGDGPLRPGACELARGLGLGEKVRFMGAVEHDAVRRAMLDSRAFVQHSVQADDGDQEGTPNAVVEAQASGLPVVATAHAGIREVVRDRESGFLVAEGDIDGMARCMLVLAREPERAAAMGMAGRLFVEGAFSFARSLRLLTELLLAASDGRLRVADR